MYLELEDYRPDTPRVPTVMSLREAILLSLLLHALALIAYLVMPEFRSRVDAVIAPQDTPPLEYVQIAPRVDVVAPPKLRADASDLDRRAASPLTAPDPRNDLPFSRGNTPEKVIGAPVEKAAGPDNASAAASDASAVPPDMAAKVTSNAAVPRPAGGSLGAALRNLNQFVQDQTYDNPQGGQSDQNADVQFDSKGVEFGPWLRRFVAQVKRNWYVPQLAMIQRGRVVIQFYVQKNGAITDLRVVSPSPIDSFNLAALNSLKLSNPTMPLPPEYPDDRALFTVTFHYNDR